MVDLKLEQLSLDWHIARLWRLTSSDLKANITSTGKLSKSETATNSLNKLIAGMELANVMLETPDDIVNMEDWELSKFMADYTGDKFKGNVHTERGNKFESDAINALSERIGKTIHDGSMIVMGESSGGVVACSPDGQVKNEDSVMIEGCEVKCPCLAVYYGIIAKDELPSQWKLQVHASMAICGLETWHFGAFFPGKPLFYKEVKWDKDTDQVKESLEAFADTYKTQYKALEAAEEKLNTETK